MTQLHLFVGFSAGVFLAATFFDMLPEAAEQSGVESALIVVLISFIVILLLERVILYRHEEEEHEKEESECDHGHLLTSVTAFVGLSVHASIAGFALGAGTVTDEAIGLIVFLAIIAHKGIEVFSLATTFRLANFSRKRGLKYVAFFAIITPIAAWLSVPLVEILGNLNVGLPLALASGTFLYVGVYDLLPEAFHQEKRRYSAFLAIIIGIVTMYLVGIVLE